MDGRVYNYNTGTWNACNENFQAACLELQNQGIPNNRDGHGMIRDPSKAMASAPSFMFFNYPTEDHIHHSNQHAMHRTAAAAQWQHHQWPKMKAHQAQSHKNFGMIKEDWSGVATNMHPGHSIFNIPPPGPFCSTDITDALQVQDNCVNVQQQQHQQNSVAVSYASHSTNTPIVTQQHHMPTATPPKPAVKKSNPKPRKKRERKKEDKEKKKRTRNEESWARNKRKKARARGESYMSVVGKVMRAKQVQPVDCSKCKFHCPDHVTEEEREELFKQYWSLESFKDKVNFLSDCVEEFVPLRPISGKRLYSRRYKLKIGTGEDEKIARVCKEFFISTFDISESTIVTFMNKKRKNPEEIKDNRGHQIPSNKTPAEVVQTIREHILSQTGLQGCLDNLQSEEVRNIKRLYTHYQSECEVEERKPASMSVYRKVYGDMHKDKTEAPVFMPPEDVLEKISPTKKSKTSKDNSSLVAQPDHSDNEDEEGLDADDTDDDDNYDDDNDVSATLPAEPLNLTPPGISQQPHQQQLTQVSQTLKKELQQTVPTSLLSASFPSSSLSPSSCSVAVKAQAEASSSNLNNLSNNVHQNQAQSHQLHHHPNSNHQNVHPHNDSHDQKPSTTMSGDKMCSLNIPMTSSTTHHPHGLIDNTTGQVMVNTSVDNSHAIITPSFDASGAHLNQLMPFMWGTHRMTQQAHCKGQATEISATADICGIQSTFATAGSLVFSNPNPHSMQRMSQSCLFSNPNTVLGTSSLPSSSTAIALSNLENPTVNSSTAAPTSVPETSISNLTTQANEVVVVKKVKKSSKPRQKSRPKKEVKKRTRNEESWGRNIRKRLRFKGEEYTSVKGKTVGAKTVQEVDCSKCKYKCSTKITKDQRMEMNDAYWNLENYENRIDFIARYVQTYVPKRKMTGRRAYSRNYTFIVDDKRIRVCKNFFITTLHISESIVATCLKKARKGPSATKDMRGKHKPVNKTPEEVLQSIRELIIYLTGVRPKRKGDTSKVVKEYQDINRLYLIYKYDSEKKGKKLASSGIFRNVLQNEFGFTGNTKFRKPTFSKMNSLSTGDNLNSKSNSNSNKKSLQISSDQIPEGGQPTVDTNTNTNTRQPIPVSMLCSLPTFSGGSTNTDQPESVELSEGSSTHPAVFSTCLLSSF